MALPTYPELLAGAAVPDSPLVLALAGVIGNAPLRSAPYDIPIAGLSRATMAQLAERFFPALEAAGLVAATPAEPLLSDREGEFDDLLQLLLAHRGSDDEAVEWLALAVATASMAGNHLWQDMGLPNRGVLNRVLLDNFPALHAKNVGDMKWKKFFYRQLCEQAEVLICQSPTCGECADYLECFGSEDKAEPIQFAPTNRPS